MEDIQETNSTDRYTFLNAAEKVLNECAERQPMHYKEISRIAIERGWLQSKGETPESTLDSEIGKEIRDDKAPSRFARDPHRPGFIYLTKWEDPASLSIEDDAMDTYTFPDAAEKVLNECAERQPMHYKEISRIAIEKGWLQTNGKTPAATMRTSISNEIMNKPASRFVWAKEKGKVSLSKWGPAEKRIENEEKQDKDQKKILLNKLREMNPHIFERFVAEVVMPAMGFEDCQATTKGSHDHGIDATGQYTMHNIKWGVTVQIKRFDEGNSVGRPDIQKLHGILSGKPREMGVFITTSKFNKNAIEEAQDKSKNPIILIDGNRLVDILIHKEWDETEDGGKPIVVKTIEIIQVNEEYFENYGKDTPDAGSES